MLARRPLRVTGLQNLRVSSPTQKAKVYASLLRPELEYCSTIGDPRKGVENNDSHIFEMVQRRAARWDWGDTSN